MKVCPRCAARPISSESEGCRACRDELEPLLRGGGPSRFTSGAVLELLAEGINVPALLYEHLRRVRTEWKRKREAALEDFRKRRGPALAARRYLEARAKGEKLTARQAGAPWGVKPGTVRMAATRLRREERHAERKGVTETSAASARAAS